MFRTYDTSVSYWVIRHFNKSIKMTKNRHIDNGSIVMTEMWLLKDGLFSCENQ